MNAIRLLDLGLAPPVRSQTVYHAVAHAMTETTPDTIILVSPDRPYVCIGYHQDPEKEVDLAYCAAHDLPVYRREVGGGAVYLDAGQVFLQWIFHMGHVPSRLEERFELFIRPLVATYRALGIPATHRPVNDVHVSGKKIGGTGAAQMGSAEVLVGSLMFTFDKATMARVLKVPSEKMRDKIFESLEQYMTTMGEQLGHTPERRAVADAYVAQCAAALAAEIVPGALAPAEEALAAELDARFASGEWLHLGGRTPRTSVKIHEDVWVGEGMFKAPGGLVRATVRVHDERIDDLALSGDFTMLPASGVSALEAALHGVVAAREPLLAAVEERYRSLEIRSPGLAPEDVVGAILAAAAPPAGSPSGRSVS
jgi:lipoate---protein ligase